MNNIELHKANSITELLNDCPQNQIIGDNLVKAWAKINNPAYGNIVCSISGGSDSDVMLDICWRCDVDNKTKFSLLSNYLNFCKIRIMPFMPYIVCICYRVRFTICDKRHALMMDKNIFWHICIKKFFSCFCLKEI